MATPDEASQKPATKTAADTSSLRSVYEAAWQHALDEDRRAQFRFYNYVLINTLFLVGFASKVAWLLWPLLGVAVSLYWWRIGDRLVQARLFWNGRLRLVEQCLFGADNLSALFQARDDFFAGQPVDLIDPRGVQKKAGMPHGLSTWSTNTTEAKQIPLLVILMWLVVLVFAVVEHGYRG
jgi:hypothetical protein